MENIFQIRMTRISLIGIVVLMLTSCKVNLEGNVYKLVQVDDLSFNEQKDLITGVRIDDIRNDTMLIKYKFGNELFMDADFIYDSIDERYLSAGKIVLGSMADKKSDVYLKIDGENLYLEFVDLLKNKEIQYKKVYHKKVDLKTHRDPYYAEDGFSL